MPSQRESLTGSHVTLIRLGSSQEIWCTHVIYRQVSVTDCGLVACSSHGYGSPAWLGLGHGWHFNQPCGLSPRIYQNGLLHMPYIVWPSICTNIFVYTLPLVTHISRTKIPYPHLHLIVTVVTDIHAISSHPVFLPILHIFIFKTSFSVLAIGWCSTRCSMLTVG